MSQANQKPRKPQLPPKATRGQPPGAARTAVNGIRVLVFLKEPRAGKVKTRLGLTVGYQNAARLYRAFLADTLSTVAGPRNWALEAHFEPGTASPNRIRALIPLELRKRFRLVPQPRGTLGKRLATAFDRAFREGARTVLAVGSDCPLLQPKHLEQALRALRRRDLVLGPARDGGYYLIGLRQPQRQLFQRIPWSTPRVLVRTLERADELGLETFLLEELPDIDTREDLLTLRERLVDEAGGVAPSTSSTLGAMRLKL